MTTQPQQQQSNEPIKLTYDAIINVAVGRSRKETQWRNKQQRWSELLTRLRDTQRTQESMAEYRSMTRDAQADIKDTGGFVGGLIKEGRRKSGNMAWRSLITLDADYAETDFAERVKHFFGNTAFSIYSTHSHTYDNPRYRLVMPIKRQVTPDEYKALSRFIAYEIGIDLFDDSTYEPERLMYWPSTSKDAPYDFYYIDAPFIDPDVFFQKYPRWNDASTWPESSRAGLSRQKHAERQGDPREKPGVVGAFNRSYGMHEAIETFLSGVYEQCDESNRYTYLHGSASAGVVVYDDDLFTYSHHGTDPAGGSLTNAFDLVRLHKFGDMDDTVADDVAINKLPSYKAMSEFALKDNRVKVQLADSRLAKAREAFSEPLTAPAPLVEYEDDTWKTQLQYTDKGAIVQSIQNTLMILRHDEGMRGRIAYDQFTRKITKKYSTPWYNLVKPEVWVDSDDASLRHYLEVSYGLTKHTIINDAVQIVMKENSFHPISEYLDTLQWDGRPRLERLLIEFFGAADNIYTREVTKKWLTAAVARIREPGAKFDYMLILVGPQGVGKSTFFSKLAKRHEWFSDSMAKLDNGKESMEQLAGRWIIELGELAGMKKYEVEHVKLFLSKQIDAYRPSYGRRTEEFPRQCVFGGTSNREDFLQDATGGRRFWPVKVKDGSAMWAQMTDAVVDQIWAEADMYYKMGEPLYLKGEVEEFAREQQEHYTELGGKAGIAGDFLEKPVPIDFDAYVIQKRLDWYGGNYFTPLDGSAQPVVKRDYITGVELYVECFGGRYKDYNKRDAYEMSDILQQVGWHRTKKSWKRGEYGKQRIFSRYREE